MKIDMDATESRPRGTVRGFRGDLCSQQVDGIELLLRAPGGIRVLNDPPYLGRQAGLLANTHRLPKNSNFRLIRNEPLGQVRPGSPFTLKACRDGG